MKRNAVTTTKVLCCLLSGLVVARCQVGVWTKNSRGDCIVENNDIKYNDVEDANACKRLCEQHQELPCRSIEYYVDHKRCNLQKLTSADGPMGNCVISDYFELLSLGATVTTTPTTTTAEACRAQNHASGTISLQFKGKQGMKGVSHVLRVVQIPTGTVDLACAEVCFQTPNCQQFNAEERADGTGWCHILEGGAFDRIEESNHIHGVMFC